MGAMFAVIVAIQRHNGGTVMGGLFRSMDFICYVIILFQTTLYGEMR